jgi:predicted metalloprotease with PDZ domain
MPEAVTYTVKIGRPEWHGIEVEASFPSDGRAEIDLMMPVWTPGSYLVREFARHVEEISAAAGGEPLPIVKTAKNRWRVQNPGLPRLEVRCRLYARDLSVRTNFVDAGFGLIQGAATFLTLAGDHRRPHEVRLVAPPRWRVAVSPLPALAGEAGPAWRAADFDQLADSPIYAGNAPVRSFEVEGRAHLLVDEGEEAGSPWDGARAAADAERVVRQQLAFWGCLPYERYVFFNLVAEGSGGLEHRDSSVLATSRWRARGREGWLEWLSLLSHELFHAWNVKRLRPVELDAFDYETEVYTRDLWQVEGVTASGQGA